MNRQQIRGDKINTQVQKKKINDPGENLHCFSSYCKGVAAQNIKMCKNRGESIKRTLATKAANPRVDPSQSERRFPHTLFVIVLVRNLCAFTLYVEESSCHICLMHDLNLAHDTNPSAYNITAHRAFYFVFDEFAVSASGDPSR
jgi:hypothetical protein